ncbi:MAG: hypothetical protein HY869_12215 [Chloroflexi bacterium]|nr:hypothetical protein [Chloroflexota bacterium]
MLQKLFQRPILFVVLGIYIVLSYQTLAVGGRLDNFFFTEDHYFENIGALGLFATSILFFYGFLRSRRQPLKDKTHWIKQLAFLGFAFIAFFGAGEEISWGQRIFNIATPEALNQFNAQGEITVHNLEFNGIELNFETAFDVFWFGVVVILPLAVLAIPLVKTLAKKYLPFVYLPIGGLFLLNYLWAKVAKLVYVGVYNYSEVVPFVQAVQEVKESHYEWLFALVALFAVLDLISNES